MCLSNHGNCSCLIHETSLWLFLRFNQFLQREQRGGAQQSSLPLSLSVKTSAHLSCLFQSLFICTVSGRWWDDTSKREDFWQLPLQIWRQAPSLRVSMTVRTGPNMNDWMHRLLSSLCGSDDATDIDIFQCSITSARMSFSMSVLSYTNPFITTSSGFTGQISYEQHHLLYIWHSVKLAAGGCFCNYFGLMIFLTPSFSFSVSREVVPLYYYTASYAFTFSP